MILTAMEERKPNNLEPQRQPDDERIPEALFELGQLVVTPGAVEALKREKRHPVQLISRHVIGDWGTLPEEDVAENEFSLKNGYRLFSSYEFESGSKYYVITEWDRSVTTVLLPAEY